MKRLASKDTLKGTLIIPTTLAVSLILFSFLIGWKFLIPALIFWFIFVPGATIYLPGLVSKNKNRAIESITGLLIFYGIVVFMIYKHFQSDQFVVMMASCAYNLFVISLVTILERPKVQVK